ncbi:MAG: tetratricopeptide repeat protein [Planctomycetota bacterium]
MTRRWRLAACAGALALAACGATSTVAGPAAAVEPCADEAAQVAWRRASAALADAAAAAAAGDPAAIARGDVAALPYLEVVATGCPDFVRGHVAFQDAALRVGGPAAARMRAVYEQRRDDGTECAAYCAARLLPTVYAQSAAFDALLARAPRFAWARLSQARIARSQGRLLAALDGLALALRDAPDLHEARRERAEALAELGRDGEAAAEYRLYLAIAPTDRAASRDFVRLLLYRLGRTAEAVPLLDRLEAEAPNDVDLRMDRAAVHWQNGELRRSAEAYLAVLAASPTATRAALNLGLLYYEVAPGPDPAAQRRFWPAARAAFRWFLDGPAPTGGFEQYERTLGVPFRLARIAGEIGPESPAYVRLTDLRWPGE